LLLLSQNEYQWRGADCCVAIPAKLYTYLRAARPILACVQESEIAELVRAYGAGAVVPPRDTAAIAAHVLAAHRSWNDAGRGWRPRSLPDLSEFSRERQTQVLAELVRQTVARWR
jgi:hypothetical protein